MTEESTTTDTGVAVVGASGGAAPGAAAPRRRAAGRGRDDTEAPGRAPDPDAVRPRGRGPARGRARRRSGAARGVSSVPADLDVIDDEDVELEPRDTGGAPGAHDGGEDAGAARVGWSPPRRGRRARRPGTVPTRLAVVLGALALIGAVAAVVFGVSWSNLQGQNSQTATVKKVSTTFLDDLTNFKPTTVDADFTALLSFATGDFAKQANQFFGSSIRQQLEQAQAQSEGQVRSVYVQSLSGGSAQVYAVVDQTYLNTSITKAGGQPVPDVLRVVLSLRQASGDWKISEVTVLQAPSSSSPATGTTTP